jgi:hypothetical protein
MNISNNVLFLVRIQRSLDTRKADKVAKFFRGQRKLALTRRESLFQLFCRFIFLRRYDDLENKSLQLFSFHFVLLFILNNRKRLGRFRMVGVALFMLLPSKSLARMTFRHRRSNEKLIVFCKRNSSY